MSDLLHGAPSNNHWGLLYDNGYINFEGPPALLASVGLWKGFYQILRLLQPNQSPEFSSRICAFLHGLVAAFMGINQCFLIDWPFDHPEWKTNYIQSFILVMSFGYFVHDFIWMCQHESNDKPMLSHHVICILSLLRIISKGYSGAQTTCSLGSMEITNPFLQTRWFLRTAGLHDSPLFKSTEITFFLVFVIVRIVLGSWFLRMILQQKKNDWDFLLMSVGIYGVSWVFVWGMVKYVMRKYKRVV